MVKSYHLQLPRLYLEILTICLLLENIQGLKNMFGACLVLDNLRESVRKNRGKVWKKRKKWKKIKNKFKINKLFLYVALSLFYLYFI